MTKKTKKVAYKPANRVADKRPKNKPGHGGRATVLVPVRMHPEEREQLRKLAARADLGVTGYVLVKCGIRDDASAESGEE